MKTIMAIGLIILFTISLTACAQTAKMNQPMISTSVESTNSTPSGRITVLAAASLTEPFSEIGELFEAQNPNTVVEFSFANSHQLAQQIIQDAPADVFASASPQNMTDIIHAGRVAVNEQSNFAGNRLVLIYPVNLTSHIIDIGDLSRPGIKVVLAGEQTPIGQYSIEFLTKVDQDPNYGTGFMANVLQNVVSYEDSVKAVLAKVALGEADAGIVYSSDVTGEAKDRVGMIEIPDELNVIARYPIAVIKDSNQPILAQKFVELVLSPDGQAILSEFGFIPVSEK